MKKVMSIFIVTLLLLSLMPATVFAEELLLEEAMAPACIYSQASETSSLDGVIDKKAFIDYIIEKSANCPTQIDIQSFKIKTSYMNAISSLIYYESPELFHFNSFSYSYYSSGIVAYIKPVYKYTAAQYPTMLNDMKSAANKLLEGVKDNPNLSDVEKALILHDRLAIWTEYDTDLSTGDQMYTAYGILADREGVCMGYALAYDYLLEQVGIENYYCRSSALNHAWNIVKINNKWYHVDVTHDDPTYDQTGRVSHINFLRSTAGLKSTSSHKANDFDTTPTDTTYDSYYWQNSDTAFQLIDNDIYYLDESSASIKKLTNISGSGTTVVSGLQTMWFVPGSTNSYYPGPYSKLSSDGECLYFNEPHKVYKYDPSTGSTSVVWDLSSYENLIYGFKWEDCKLYCILNSTPNFTETTEQNNLLTSTYHKTNASTGWVIEKFATATTNGLKSNTCSGCGLKETATTSTTGTSCITARSGNTIDYTNKIIIADTTLCNNILNLVNKATTVKLTAEEMSYVQGNTKYIGTGTKCLLDTGTETAYFTVVIDGDLNGDSVCDVLDAALAAKYANYLDTPTDIEVCAATGEMGDYISPTDYQNLVNKAVS